MLQRGRVLAIVKDILSNALYALVFGKLLKHKEGARLLTGKEVGGFLSSKNTGLLIDGNKGRLSERESFQNVCVIARVGAGKTTRYIIPNVLDKAKSKCSIVVNDPKGEVFTATSGYMQANGYKVLVLHPEQLSASSRFNPLLEARDTIELEQIAEILVKAGAGSSPNDEFWNQGAIRLVSVLLKLLQRAGEEDPAFFTLGNLYHLLQHFGEKGELLDDFVIKYAYDPLNPSDSTLWDEWQGVVTGNKTAIQSFALTALTALRAFTNQAMVELTSSSSFSLEAIRGEKTIIYFVIPAQHAEYYGFWTSLFFRSVFNASMRRLPDKSTLPLYVLYDEFGHSTLPGFVSVANTIRGYGVSLSIVLQSIAQLSARYGPAYAASIQGGFGSYLSYSGADPQTTQFLEGMSGRVVEHQKNKIEDFRTHRSEYNLLNADAIRTMNERDAIFVSANRYPAVIPTLPYFENGSFARTPKRFGQALISGAKSSPVKRIALR
jgi:type IV secretion system protein VirD4